MERIKFAELPLDTKTPTLALLQSIEESETKTGKAYVRMTLSDGDSVITANLWNKSKAEIQVEERTVIAVELYPKIYEGNVGYEVFRYGPCNDAQVTDFIIKAPFESEAMYDEILSLISKGAGENGLYRLVKAIYEENKTKLLYWSAAKSVHHNCYGGLLYHTLRMMRSAFTLTKVYTTINKDVLFAAVALHDIGKITELETDELGIADYTVDGTLFGHALLGIEMINAKASGYNPESIRLLKHCLAAHHGQLDWGAVTVPAIAEAMMLHEIDMIDSRMYQFEKAVEEITEPGQLGDKVFGLGTKVYRPII